MKFKHKFDYREILIVASIIIVIGLVVFLGVKLKHNKINYNKLLAENNAITAELKSTKETNNNLQNENKNLKEDISQKNETIAKLQKENEELHAVKVAEPTPIAKQTSKTTQSETKKSTTDNTKAGSNYGSKKTYMYYTSITNKKSAQWKLQTKAVTNQYGVRVIREDGREYACVAIGTGWNSPVGTKLYVTTTNGGYYAIVGDIKANSHTRADHKVGTDGSITEFIVDKTLQAKAKKAGNLNVIGAYNGDVLNIEGV